MKVGKRHKQNRNTQSKLIKKTKKNNNRVQGEILVNSQDYLQSTDSKELSENKHKYKQTVTVLKTYANNSRLAQITQKKNKKTKHLATNKRMKSLYTQLLDYCGTCSCCNGVCGTRDGKGECFNSISAGRERDKYCIRTQ